MTEPLSLSRLGGREWIATRWWRAVDPESREIWIESSDESEVRDRARPHDVIEHLWREAALEEWRVADHD